MNRDDVVEELAGTSENEVEGYSLEDCEEIMVEAGYERSEADVWVETCELPEDS